PEANPENSFPIGLSRIPCARSSAGVPPAIAWAVCPHGSEHTEFLREKCVRLEKSVCAYSYLFCLQSFRPKREHRRAASRRTRNQISSHPCLAWICPTCIITLV